MAITSQVVQVKEIIEKNKLYEVKEIRKAVKAFDKFREPTKKRLIAFYEEISAQQIKIIDNPRNYTDKDYYKDNHSFFKAVATESKSVRKNVKNVFNLFCPRTTDTQFVMNNCFSADVLTEESLQKLDVLKKITRATDDWWCEVVFFIDDLRVMGFKNKEETFYI